MSTKYIIVSMFVMALTTYVIRMLPMAIFRKKINDKRVQSFLYYVPYAVLSAMTFPAIFSSTGSEVSAVVGCVVAIVLAYMKRGLLTVAVGAAVAVFLEKSIPEVLYLKDERMVLRGFRKPGARLQPDREGTAGEPGR